MNNEIMDGCWLPGASCETMWIMHQSNKREKTMQST